MATDMPKDNEMCIRDSENIRIPMNHIDATVIIDKHTGVVEFMSFHFGWFPGPLYGVRRVEERTFRIGIKEYMEPVSYTHLLTYGTLSQDSPSPSLIMTPRMFLSN